MEDTIKAIVGLGNPGREYQYTRHNIGFRVLDSLAQQHNASWSQKENMLIAEIRDRNNSLVILIKPQTYMNNSGRVMNYLTKKGIKAPQILVVHDELEKPFGTVILKQGGSHKGHNGLKSIISVIGLDFWRLKVGIGRPEHKEEVPKYVLENFKESSSDIENIIDKALKALHL